jgi:hypothetical protein
MSHSVCLVFGFEEVNTPVLLNSQAYLIKKAQPDVNFAGFVPPGFTSVFSALDSIRTMESRDLAFRSYSEVSDYLPPRSARDRITGPSLKALHASGMRGPLLARAVNAAYRQPRARRFLFDTGLWSKVNRTAASEFPGHTVLQTMDFIDLGQIRVFTVDLGESFNFYFRKHALAIELGLALSPASVMLEPGDVGSSYAQLCAQLSHRIGSQPAFLVRTRNFANKAPMHNTDVKYTTELVEHLLSRGAYVVNVGTPAAKLPIESSSYHELSNELSIDEEVALCGRMRAVFTRADAGLFTLFSSVATNIVTVSPEWSQHFGVHLMESRAKRELGQDLVWESGICDLSPRELADVAIKQYT